MQSAAISEDDVLPYSEVFSLPLGLYLAWQLGYWFIIEVPYRICTDISTVLVLVVVTGVWLLRFPKRKKLGTWYLLSTVPVDFFYMNFLP